MDQYTIQSYFKSLCKTYCIAQEQLKRTKKEISELEKEVVSSKNFDALEDPYEIRKIALEKDKSFWSNIINNLAEEVERVVYTIAYNEQSIIITSKEEIIVLATFFYVNGLTKHKIINTEERYLRAFPEDKEFYIKFLEAYCTENEKLMDKVYVKYVR